jgi:hypothetical protein
LFKKTRIENLVALALKSTLLQLSPFHKYVQHDRFVFYKSEEKKNNEYCVLYHCVVNNNKEAKTIFP